MLTPDGATLIWTRVAPPGAAFHIAVLGSNGEEAVAEARAEIDGPTLRLTATFAADQGNFEWTAREVRSAGAVIDHEADDGGRKPAGAVWDIQIDLDLTIPTAA